MNWFDWLLWATGLCVWLAVASLLARDAWIIMRRVPRSIDFVRRFYAHARTRDGYKPKPLPILVWRLFCAVFENAWSPPSYVGFKDGTSVYWDEAEEGYEA